MYPARELAALPARPAIRVVPAPVAAPPFDDDPRPRPVLRLVAEPAVVPAVDESVWFSQDRTPAAQLPDPAPLVRQLLQGCLEVFAGARPLTQLRRQLSVELYAEFAARLHGGRRRPGGRPRPHSVPRVHVQTRPEGVVEACASVRRGDRLHALALRLEGHGDRWVCTALEGL